jgi:hypothetical protein
VTVLDEDVLLAISATATAPDGSAMELGMQVHRPLAWDDPSAATLSSLMTAGCEGSLEQSVYEQNLWSFVAVDINAKPTADSATWSGEPIDVLPVPSDEFALASDGSIHTDDDVDMATPYCVRSRYVDGAGDSLLVVGIAGDTDEAGAAGQFTRWANAAYGFSVAGGVALTDCTFLVTDAGKELNGGADWWSQVVTGSECVIGAESV